MILKNYSRIIKEYAKLSSAHFVLLTSIIPVSGALAMGEARGSHLVILFLIGVFAHIYGFAFNHYNDIKIDGLTPLLKERPLPSGTINKKHAALYIVTVLLLGLLLTFCFFEIKIFIIYCFSVILATLYDIGSKKIGGMDFILAASITMIAIFGSATVSFQFTTLAYIIWILSFIQTVNFTMIAGGIKDADHDFLINSKHLSTVLGVRVKDDLLLVPNSFQVVAYVFAIVYAIFVFTPIVLNWITLPIIFIIVLILINILFFCLTYKMMRKRKYDRQEIRKYVVLHYTVNWLNVPILLLTITPFAIILIIFPLLGLIISNILLYKTIFRPKMM